MKKVLWASVALQLIGFIFFLIKRLSPEKTGFTDLPVVLGALFLVFAMNYLAALIGAIVGVVVLRKSRSAPQESQSRAALLIPTLFNGAAFVSYHLLLYYLFHDL